jgi:hypothetical protein
MCLIKYSYPQPYHGDLHGNKITGGFSMKKSKLLVVGLISLLLAGGLFITGCETEAEEEEANNGIIKVFNEESILNDYTTATVTVNYASQGLDSDHAWLIDVGAVVKTSQALGLNQTVTFTGCPTGVGLCVVVDDGHIGSSGSSTKSNSDRFVLSKGQTINLTYDGFFVEIPKDLSGTIAITPSAGVTVGTELTANYSGNETVKYQWKKDGANTGTGSKYTPDVPGSYTVTVSASGYISKTSAAVTVTGSPLAAAVYTAGYYEDSSGSQIACYWKNGIKTDLSQGLVFPKATAIAVQGPDVYVAGYYVVDP